MVYSFFSDLHLGGTVTPESLERFQAYLSLARQKGNKVVFLGDIYELDSNLQASQQRDFIREGDYWLWGNHDPYPVPGTLFCTHFEAPGLFAIHGDEFDFQYLFAYLQYQSPWYARAVRWKREHALLFYRSLIEGSLSSRELVYGRPFWKRYLRYLGFLWNMIPLFWKQPTSIYPQLSHFQPVPGPWLLPPPEVRLARIRALWPNASAARIILHGHTHYPRVDYIDHTLLVDLGAWTEGHTPVVAHYDDRARELLLTSPALSEIQLGSGVESMVQRSVEGYRFYL